MDDLTNKRIAELLSKSRKGSAKLVKEYEQNIKREYAKALADIKKKIADMFEQ